jgi:hypothetical protein
MTNEVRLFASWLFVLQDRSHSESSRVSVASTIKAEVGECTRKELLQLIGTAEGTRLLSAAPILRIGTEHSCTEAVVRRCSS